MWSGKNPSYSHLRIFGCLAFADVSNELRQNLDAMTTPCNFIAMEMRNLDKAMGPEGKEGHQKQ